MTLDTVVAGDREWLIAQTSATLGATMASSITDTRDGTDGHAPRLIRVDEGEVMGPPHSQDRYLVNGADTGGRFALVEHIIGPGVLAAPMHRHNREDEFTFVREGRVGFLLEGREVIAEEGQLLFKPRGQWHTFWNPGPGTARMLEMISPSGLEDLFREIDSLADWPEPSVFEEMIGRYGIDMDLERTSAFAELRGLEF